MAKQQYLHGFSSEEQERLKDQNDVLAKYIYKDLDLNDCKHLLEVGCGVGAQMEYVLEQYESITVTGVDVSTKQIDQALINLRADDYKNRFELINTEIANAKLTKKCDGLLIVWVLEHVSNPLQLLEDSIAHLEPQSNFWITEVNNQSLKIEGVDSSVNEVWSAMNEYQASLGGDGNVGAKLVSYLDQIQSIEQYDVNHRLLQWGREDIFHRNEMLNYWIELMKSSAASMLDSGFITNELWTAAQNTMKAACHRDDASFSYAFVQATGTIE